MKNLNIPIYERSRKYGYVYWTKNLDSDVQKFFKDKTNIDIIFDGAKLGNKFIDYKNRRISVGWRWTRALPEMVNEFILIKNKDLIDIKCQ